MKLVLLAALFIGGASFGADIEFHQYGKMREVLRDGKTEARVIPTEVCSNNSWGLGAMAGLEGEITIVDGKVLVATGSMELREGTAEDSATMFYFFNVQDWESIAIEKDIPANEIDSYLNDKNISDLFPFRIEGSFSNLDFHVITGSCPINGGEPLRDSVEFIDGQLIGIFASDAEGVITHHGSKTHIHVITDEKRPRTGHVEAVTIKKGSLIYFPK
ncbi:MAG: acetolactate decarboxylase [bacterium]|nr:acetolactate decarboxylase [bacterium]